MSVSVDDSTGVWERRFYDFATAHAETLLGFKPGRTNTITVTVYDGYRNQATVPVGGGAGPGCLTVNLKDIGFTDHAFTTPRGLLVSNPWQHVAATYSRLRACATAQYSGRPR